MKQYVTDAVIVLSPLAIVILMNTQHAKSLPPAEPKAEKAPKVEKLLRHVVLFKFKDEATQEQIDAVVKGFGELPKKIDTIKAYEWGTNNSPEDHAQGYTHCFLVTFANEADRDAYLPHPAHQEFVEVLLPILDEVHVVDYWTNK